MEGEARGVEPSLFFVSSIHCYRPKPGQLSCLFQNRCLFQDGCLVFSSTIFRTRPKSAQLFFSLVSVSYRNIVLLISLYYTLLVLASASKTTGSPDALLQLLHLDNVRRHDSLQHKLSNSIALLDLVVGFRMVE